MLNSGPDDDIYVSHKAHRLDVFGFSVFMPDSVQHHSLCAWPLNVNSYHATGRMKERKKGVNIWEKKKRKTQLKDFSTSDSTSVGRPWDRL